MSSFKSKQTGFTVVEALLVILVIAIVGFGGYYVVHSQKSKNANNSSMNTSQTTAKQAVKSTQANPTAAQPSYLKVVPFNIELPLTSQIADLTFDTIPNVPGTLMLESNSVLGNLYHQINPNCIAEKYPLYASRLTTTAPGFNETAKATATVNGTTYYLYSKGGGAPCDDPTDNFSPDFNPTAAQQAQIDAYMTAAYNAVTNAKAIN